MTDAEHYRKLEHLYAAAPISRWYGVSITVGDGRAEVGLPVRPEFYHAARATGPLPIAPEVPRIKPAGNDPSKRPLTGSRLRDPL